MIRTNLAEVFLPDRRNQITQVLFIQKRAPISIGKPKLCVPVSVHYNIFPQAFPDLAFNRLIICKRVLININFPAGAACVLTILRNAGKPAVIIRPNLFHFCLISSFRPACSIFVNHRHAKNAATPRRVAGTGKESPRRHAHHWRPCDDPVRYQDSC